MSFVKYLSITLLDGYIGEGFASYCIFSVGLLKLSNAMNYDFIFQG